MLCPLAVLSGANTINTILLSWLILFILWSCMFYLCGALAEGFLAVQHILPPLGTCFLWRIKISLIFFLEK